MNFKQFVKVKSKRYIQGAIRIRKGSIMSIPLAVREKVKTDENPYYTLWVDGTVIGVGFHPDKVSHANKFSHSIPLKDLFLEHQELFRENGIDPFTFNYPVECSINTPTPEEIPEGAGVAFFYFDLATARTVPGYENSGLVMAAFGEVPRAA